jgi:ribulose-bisphosphate carboxylase large chain
LGPIRQLGYVVDDIEAGMDHWSKVMGVAGETDELRARAAAEVIEISLVGETQTPTLQSAYVQRKNIFGPYRQARIRIAYPIANIGQNLPTLAATVSVNLYDIGEITCLKLLSLDIPRDYRARFYIRRLASKAHATVLAFPTGPSLGQSSNPTSACVQLTLRLLSINSAPQM